jgi:hypothetical protein
LADVDIFVMAGLVPRLSGWIFPNAPGMRCPPLPSGEVGETLCVEPGEGFNFIDEARTLTRLAFAALRRGDLSPLGRGETADAARAPRLSMQQDINSAPAISHQP